MRILAYYNDLAAATQLLDADPSLADDAEALTNAAERGHETFVRLLLRHSPATAKRVLGGEAARDGRAAVRARHGSRPPELDAQARRSIISRATATSRAPRSTSITARISKPRMASGARLRSLARRRPDEREWSSTSLRRGARVNPLGGPPWAKPIAWAERRGHTEIVRSAARVRSNSDVADKDARGRTRSWPTISFARTAVTRRRSIGSSSYFKIQRPLRWDRPPLDVQVDRLRRAVRERLGAETDTGVR